MRIVGGSFKGRRFKAPNKIPARPTTDYAKEALFNILQNSIDWSECDMLDLFTGIGSISIEAISRGAQSVTAIDQNQHSITWLHQLKNELNVPNLFPVKAEAMRWLDRSEKHYQFVFADPPYDFKNYDDLIDKVLNQSVADDGMFILEHRKSLSFKEHPNFVEERNYGEVGFSWFRK